MKPSAELFTELPVGFIVLNFLKGEVKPCRRLGFNTMKSPFTKLPSPVVQQESPRKGEHKEWEERLQVWNNRTPLK